MGSVKHIIKSVAAIIARFMRISPFQISLISAVSVFAGIKERCRENQVKIVPPLTLSKTNGAIS
jgi:hypothetical protein